MMEKNQEGCIIEMPYVVFFPPMNDNTQVTLNSLNKTCVEYNVISIL
jgi:hypothetical protein